LHVYSTNFFLNHSHYFWDRPRINDVTFSVAQQPNSGQVASLFKSVDHTQSDTHSGEGSSTQVISLLQRPLPTQQTTKTRQAIYV